MYSVLQVNTRDVGAPVDVSGKRVVFFSARELVERLYKVIVRALLVPSRFYAAFQKRRAEHTRRQTRTTLRCISRARRTLLSSQPRHALLELWA